MSFTDMHIHALFGCDDGAKTEAEMLQMVDMAYAAGTKLMCLTPHCHPGYFKENQKQADLAFEILQAHAAEHCPDLVLCLGNELRGDKAAVEWLESGLCRTLNDTRFVLVDFLAGESRDTILDILRRLMNAGYMPVLAHVERYRALRCAAALLRGLKEDGVVLQMDAGSPLGQYGFFAKLWSRRLLKLDLIDVVGSDGHGTDRYPPGMQAIGQYLRKKYGPAYADALCRKNGAALLRAEP